MHNVKIFFFFFFFFCQWHTKLYYFAVYDKKQTPYRTLLIGQGQPQKITQAFSYIAFSASTYSKFCRKLSSYLLEFSNMNCLLLTQFIQALIY